MIHKAYVWGLLCHFILVSKAQLPSYGAPPTPGQDDQALAGSAQAPTQVPGLPAEKKAAKEGEGESHGDNHHHHHGNPLDWLRDSVPGEPGVDYPIFGIVPQTSFNCVDRIDGLYADVEARCQAWHTCFNGQIWSFLCPNGTIFDQTIFTCVWWYNFDCGSAEQFYNLNEGIYIEGVGPADLGDQVPNPSNVLKTRPGPSGSRFSQSLPEFISPEGTRGNSIAPETNGPEPRRPRPFQSTQSPRPLQKPSAPSRPQAATSRPITIPTTPSVNSINTIISSTKRPLVAESRTPEPIGTTYDESLPGYVASTDQTRFPPRQPNIGVVNAGASGQQNKESFFQGSTSTQSSSSFGSTTSSTFSSKANANNFNSRSSTRRPGPTKGVSQRPLTSSTRRPSPTILSTTSFSSTSRRPSTTTREPNPSTFLISFTTPKPAPSPRPTARPTQTSKAQVFGTSSTTTYQEETFGVETFDDPLPGYGRPSPSSPIKIGLTPLNGNKRPATLNNQFNKQSTGFVSSSGKTSLNRNTTPSTQNKQYNAQSSNYEFSSGNSNSPVVVSTGTSFKTETSSKSYNVRPDSFTSQGSINGVEFNNKSKTQFIQKVRQDSATSNLRNNVNTVGTSTIRGNQAGQTTLTSSKASVNKKGGQINTFSNSNFNQNNKQIGQKESNTYNVGSQNTQSSKFALNSNANTQGSKFNQQNRQTNINVLAQGTTQGKAVNDGKYTSVSSQSISFGENGGNRQSFSSEVNHKEEEGSSLKVVSQSSSKGRFETNQPGVKITRLPTSFFGQQTKTQSGKVTLNVQNPSTLTQGTNTQKSIFQNSQNSQSSKQTNLFQSARSDSQSGKQSSSFNTFKQNSSESNKGSENAFKSSQVEGNRGQSYFQGTKNQRGQKQNERVNQATRIQSQNSGQRFPSSSGSKKNSFTSSQNFKQTNGATGQSIFQSARTQEGQDFGQVNGAYQTGNNGGRQQNQGINVQSSQTFNQGGQTFNQKGQILKQGTKTQGQIFQQGSQAFNQGQTFSQGSKTEGSQQTFKQGGQNFQQGTQVVQTSNQGSKTQGQTFKQGNQSFKQGGQTFNQGTRTQAEQTSGQGVKIQEGQAVKQGSQREQSGFNKQSFTISTNTQTSQGGKKGKGALRGQQVKQGEVGYQATKTQQSARGQTVVQGTRSPSVREQSGSDKKSSSFSTFSQTSKGSSAQNSNAYQASSNAKQTQSGSRVSSSQQGVFQSSATRPSAPNKKVSSFSTYTQTDIKGGVQNLNGKQPNAANSQTGTKATRTQTTIIRDQSGSKGTQTIKDQSSANKQSSSFSTYTQKSQGSRIKNSNLSQKASQGQFGFKNEQTQGKQEFRQNESAYQAKQTQKGQFGSSSGTIGTSSSVTGSSRFNNNKSTNKFAQTSQRSQTTKFGVKKTSTNGARGQTTQGRQQIYTNSGRYQTTNSQRGQQTGIRGQNSAQQTQSGSYGSSNDASKSNTLTQTNNKKINIQSGFNGSKTQGPNAYKQNVSTSQATRTQGSGFKAQSAATGTRSSSTTRQSNKKSSTASTFTQSSQGGKAQTFGQRGTFANGFNNQSKFKGSRTQGKQKGGAFQASKNQQQTSQTAFQGTHSSSGGERIENNKKSSSSFSKFSQTSQGTKTQSGQASEGGIGLESQAGKEQQTGSTSFNTLTQTNNGRKVQKFNQKTSNGVRVQSGIKRTQSGQSNDHSTTNNLRSESKYQNGGSRESSSSFSTYTQNSQGNGDQSSFNQETSVGGHSRTKNQFGASHSTGNQFFDSGIGPTLLSTFARQDAFESSGTSQGNGEDYSLDGTLNLESTDTFKKFGVSSNSNSNSRVTSNRKKNRVALKRNKIFGNNFEFGRRLKIRNKNNKISGLGLDTKRKKVLRTKPIREFIVKSSTSKDGKTIRRKEKVSTANGNASKESIITFFSKSQPNSLSKSQQISFSSGASSKGSNGNSLSSSKSSSFNSESFSEFSSPSIDSAKPAPSLYLGPQTLLSFEKENTDGYAEAFGPIPVNEFSSSEFSTFEFDDEPIEFIPLSDPFEPSISPSTLAPSKQKPNNYRSEGSVQVESKGASGQSLPSGESTFASASTTASTYSSSSASSFASSTTSKTLRPTASSAILSQEEEEGYSYPAPPKEKQLILESKKIEEEEGYEYPVPPLDQQLQLVVNNKASPSNLDEVLESAIPLYGAPKF